MKFGSVCSGIEAASVAWKPLGWECAFVSEIEAFPRAVLQHHYPEVPLHGDFTTIGTGNYAPIDLLVGGTPCQSFSVAGLRGGLDDARGNLALEYLRLADRLRPRWLVWENVPGVLSSNDGRDFGSILGGMVELGYGFAYRVLDAQFFGVAQRRRRVFVVGYLGDWRRAAAVLFERHSLSGHPAPSREAGESAATSARERAAFGGNDTRGPIDVATACNAHGGPAGRLDFESETFVAYAPEVAATIPARSSRGGGQTNSPGHNADQSLVCFSSKDHGADALNDLAPTLRAGGHDGSHANAGVPPAIVQPIVMMERGRGGEPNLEYRQDGTANAILTPNGGRGGLGVGAFAAQSAVRRLTPRECERLQGFPEVENTLRIFVCRSEEEKRARASSASRSSALLAQDQSAPVAVHVRIDLERQLLQLHSLGRSPWSASIADLASSSRLPMPADAFAQLAALTNDAVASSVRTGREASPTSTPPSTPVANGSASVLLCGPEIAELASDAERFTAALSRCSRSITSRPGPNIPICGSILETLACCVAHAMTGFIPEAIRGACSYELRLTAHQGYTHIPWRKGMAPDGPRYKALGNSMAVPVMSWLGRRIQSVEALNWATEAA